MSEFSGFFTGGAGGDDGPYSASFFTGMFEALFNQQENLNAGVLHKTGNGVNEPLEVTESSPASNAIEVKSGKALIQGYYYINDADLSFTISANNDASGFDRIDSVILEIDFINNVVRCEVLEGTASAFPTPPTLTKNTTVYQILISNISVANLFTTIVTADIDNTVRNTSILWDSDQGGTGIEGGYSLGDALMGNSTGSLSVIDTRASLAYLSVSGASLTSPVPIDTSSDLAGNFRASVSSNRFYPIAGLFKVFAWMTVQNSGTSNVATRFDLYDVTAGSVVTDINGIDASSPLFYSPASEDNIMYLCFELDMEFDGTEVIEIRPSSTVSTMKYVASGTSVRPSGVMVTRKG